MYKVKSKNYDLIGQCQECNCFGDLICLYGCVIEEFRYVFDLYDPRGTRYEEPSRADEEVMD